MAQMNFNSNDVPDYDGVPAGTHNVRIVHSDIVPTKAGTGKILVLRVQVEDGPSKGMIHFERLNIINPNATAQSISQRRLADLMAAMHLSGELTDTETLHNIPFSATFIVKDEGAYGKKSEMKKVAQYGVAPTGQVGGQERGGGSPGAGNTVNGGQMAAGQGQQQDAASAGQKMPWDKDIDDEIPF